MYDYVIVTHLPSFYKVNLYNEISKRLKVFVVFLSNDTDEKRGADFSNVSNIDFDYTVLNGSSFQHRNKLVSLYKTLLIILRFDYKKLLICGWDLPEFWLAAFCSSTKKNCLALESTAIESSVKGVKGYIKRLFLKRIDTAFPSGDLHCELLESLEFNGSIKITRGVGIINKHPYNEVVREYKRRFLFVGRLSEVKNVATIILIFNKMPDYTLTIVGDGDELDRLKVIASENIFFLGEMKNSELKNQYLYNDFFILPSTSETWGLVVEEALYFGCPVLISKNCGSRELIEDGVNGFIIDPYDSVQIKSIIESIDRSNYQDLLIGMSKHSIDSKDIDQVNVY